MVTETVLKQLINFLGPVVAIALIIYVVIKAFGIFKGNEGATFKSLIVGVLLIVFILGIMYGAGSFKTYGEVFQNFTTSAIEQVGNNATQIVGGSAAE